MLWLLLTIFPVLAAGQNVSATKPPLYNATTVRHDTVATGFHVPSSIFQPSTTYRSTARTDTKATDGTGATDLASQHTATPTSAMPSSATRKPTQITSAEPFVLPEVDGLVRGEIRPSMDGETAANVTAPATATQPLPRSLAAETSTGSSTVEDFGATVTSAIPFYRSTTLTTRPAVASTTSTFSEADYVLPHIASLYPELDLLNYDDSPHTSGALPSTTDVPMASTVQGAPAADQATADYDMSKERYCIAARYCYKELNERCVMRHMKSVCGCGRAFSRNPETLVCERKLPLLVSLELPEHSYVQELADKKSLEFRTYESAAQHLMWGLVRRSPVLQKAVLDIEVTGFRPGLLLRSRLVVMSSLVQKFTGDVSTNLLKEFETAIDGYNATGSFLRVRKMRTVSANVAVNPCEDRDSNYCSPHAICTYRKQDYGMTCRCLPGHEDLSPDTGHHPGELCFSICEPGHCQNNGTCKSLGFGIECECRDWYVGNKCQFQMKQIIAILVVVAAVLLTAVGVAVHKFWMKGRRQNCSNMVCRMLIMEPAKRGSSKMRPLDVKLDHCKGKLPGAGVHHACGSTMSPRDASLRSAFSESLGGTVRQVAVPVVSK